MFVMNAICGPLECGCASASNSGYSTLSRRHSDLETMPIRTAPALLALTIVLTCIDSTAHARLVRLQIDQREVIAQGQSFGNAGPYERLTGTAYFEVDP